MARATAPTTPSIPPVTPSRGGTSPIGTTSPNTGSSANTNSTYAQGAFASGVNYVSLDSSYTVQNTDYQGTVIFDTDSSISVTLNSSVQQNFTCDIVNLKTGAMTLSPTMGYLVNGTPTLELNEGVGVTVFFANRAWLALAGAMFIPIVPVTISPTLGEYLNSYNAGTGIFGTNTLAGIDATIVTAALDSGGTQGNMTFVGGLLTAFTPAT